MRLSPPHPWNTQDSHSHTSPLMKTPPHQKVQNCYWNYLMTDLKIQHFWCPSRRSHHHHHQWSPWMSPGINSGRIRASTDERIANKRARMGVLRPPFPGWLFDPWGPSLLPRASSLYNSFPLHLVLLSLLSCKSYPAQPCLKKSTLPHIAVGVFVTDVAHNRCCAGQRNSHRKFQSRKRRRKSKSMTRIIIVCFEKKLESLFQRRALIRLWCLYGQNNHTTNTTV